MGKFVRCAGCGEKLPSPPHRKGQRCHHCRRGGA